MSGLLLAPCHSLGTNSHHVLDVANIFCHWTCCGLWICNADTGMVDLTMNVVERVTGGFSAGGGLSGNGYVRTFHDQLRLSRI